MMRTCLDRLAPNDCICYGPDAGGCLCPDTERVLRAYIAGRPMPPMTLEQREFCLTEISSIESFSRDEYKDANDTDLARGVLEAWASYCQDIGLL